VKVNKVKENIFEGNLNSVVPCTRVYNFRYSSYVCTWGSPVGPAEDSVAFVSSYLENTNHILQFPVWIYYWLWNSDVLSGGYVQSVWIRGRHF